MKRQRGFISTQLHRGTAGSERGRVGVRAGARGSLSLARVPGPDRALPRQRGGVSPRVRAYRRPGHLDDARPGPLLGNVRDRRRADGAPARLWGNAPAGDDGRIRAEGIARASARGRPARDRPDRHRPRVRHVRGADRGCPPSVSGRPRDRDEGRARPRLPPRWTARAPASRLRGEPAPAARRHDRSLAASRARSRRSARRAARRHSRPARRGQGPLRRRLERVYRGVAPRTRADRDRHRPEPLQPRRPGRRRRAAHV
jgi:hypothetical protein